MLMVASVTINRDVEWREDLSGSASASFTACETSACIADDPQLAQFKRDFINLQHAWGDFESQEHPDDHCSLIFLVVLVFR